jgi:hypothetical protein
LTYNSIGDLDIKNGDRIRLDLSTGDYENLSSDKKSRINPFYEVQMEIYQNGGVF